MVQLNLFPIITSRFVVSSGRKIFTLAHDTCFIHVKAPQRE